MISRMDEYLVHQTEKPLAQVASDHPDWQDRFYFNIHDRQGRFAAITGLGAFPNRNFTQAYLLVLHEGQHYSYLNVRPLDHDRHDMRAGSLSFSIVEPLVAWRLDLADEANGIHASLEFRARCPLYLFSPIHWQKGDTLVVDQMHYTQAGLYSGSFSIGDHVFTDLQGMRDRSWGVRAMSRVDTWVWISAQFPRFCISAWLWETSDGETVHVDGALVPEEGQVQPITGVQHDLELWPGTKRPRLGRFALKTEAGETLSLEAAEIGSLFLGRSPSRWSESDPEALREADANAFGFDQHCRFTLGGKTGYGIVEYMMTGGSRRYGIPATQVQMG